MTPPGIAKCPTGIRGLDQITGGGLPRGRSTLVCGSAGSGKTLLAMEFVVRGVREFGEPGVFMAFEETQRELTDNVHSLGFDLADLVQQKLIAIDYVQVERSEIEETGEYDLEGLFLRLNYMIQQTGAKRVVLDSLEALFAALPNEAILRAELRRLFRWLKDQGVTAVITAEQGAQTLTRHGLEEYISDCVIFLDHRVTNQIATRRLRVVKYRGSAHGTSEYPTTIDERGLSVLPLSSLGLAYEVSDERVPSGAERLDTMLGGKGYFRGSSILVSGTAGAGKTSLAAAFVDAQCRRGERCLYLAFEESPHQILRNMRSVSYDLEPWVKAGLLHFHAVRSTLYGLEQHLVALHKLTDEFHPAAVVVDPVTNLLSMGVTDEVKAMLTRVIDHLKTLGVTALFTSLTSGGEATERTEVNISSLMDTWVLLRNLEASGERNRLLYVLKSRGMAHSNQVREFLLTSEGIQLTDAYVGPGEVLAGSARLQQMARDRAEVLTAQQRTARRQAEIAEQRRQVQSEVDALQARAAALTDELRLMADEEQWRYQATADTRAALESARQTDVNGEVKP
ncbi:MAG: circadian clock protein KaiC [Armatimonadetes bacterium]|nr:circadian clock protein KaiC [Armatimonadota bacterium]